MIEMITVAVSGVQPRHLIQEISAPNSEDQKIGLTVMLSHKMIANGTIIEDEKCQIVSAMSSNRIQACRCVEIRHGFRIK